MSKEKLDYNAIQTDPSIWAELLKLNPIHPDEVFLEPFAGENSLFDQVQTNKKQWCEITKGRDLFDTILKIQMSRLSTLIHRSSLISQTKKV